MIKYNKLN